MSISGNYVSLSTVGDFISMSPESLICDGQKGTSLKFQLEFDEEPVIDENFIIKIKDREWPMTSGEIELPNDEIFELFENKTSLDVFLSSDGLEWNIATTKIIQDWLAKAHIDLIIKEENIQLDLKFSGNEWFEQELSVDLEIYTVDENSFEILTTKTTVEVKLVENEFIIPIKRPSGRYLGTKTTLKIKEGDITRHYTKMNEQDKFVLTSHTNIPISEYWGRGRSNITLYAYRMNDDGPERSVKENCQKKILRKLAREWLETLELELDDISLTKLHQGKICFKYKLGMSFVSSKYDLAELYENEFLNSEFVKLSAELYVFTTQGIRNDGSLDLYTNKEKMKELMYYSGREKILDLHLSCENGKISGSTILNKTQRRKLSKSRKLEVFYQTWNSNLISIEEKKFGGEYLSESEHINTWEIIPSSEKFPLPKFKHSVGDNKLIIKFEDGKLCNKIQFEIIGHYGEHGPVSDHTGLVCSKCKSLLSGFPLQCVNYKCAFDGYTQKNEYLGFEGLEDGSILVEFDKKYDKFTINLTEDKETASHVLSGE